MYNEQKTPWWTWMLYAIAVTETAVVVLGMVGFVDLEGSVIAYVALTGGSILFWLLAAVFGSYFVRFEKGVLSFGYRYWNVAVPATDVAAAETEEVGLMTFGGFGWRIDGKKRIGYVVWSGPAVQVKLTSGRCYVANCEKPDELISLLSGDTVAA